MPDRNFVKVANDLARSKVDPNQKAVLLYLLSHKPGFRVLQTSMQTALGMAPKSVRDAIAGLEAGTGRRTGVEHGVRLVRQPVLNAGGNQVGTNWFVSSTPMSDDQIAKYSAAKIVQSGASDTVHVETAGGFHGVLGDFLGVSGDSEEGDGGSNRSTDDGSNRAIDGGSIRATLEDEASKKTKDPEDKRIDTRTSQTPDVPPIANTIRTYVDDRTYFREPLHPLWEPNGQHVDAGKRYGLRICGPNGLETPFGYWATETDAERTSWDATFGMFIKCCADRFEDPGVGYEFQRVLEPTDFDVEDYRVPTGWIGSNACRDYATARNVDYDAAMSSFITKVDTSRPHKTLEREFKQFVNERRSS
jgi:hypothetical protein